MDIRRHTTLVGVFPVIPYMGSAGRSPLGLCVTQYAGRFTLPFEAAWGGMVLPEGDYVLYFGTLGEGFSYVEIHGTDTNEDSPKGIFLIRQQSPATVVQNSLVCVRKGGKHTIRALELPAIGKSVAFTNPNTRKPLESRDISGEAHPAGVPR